MSISALGTSPFVAPPVTLPRENEATETKPDKNEANEAAQQTFRQEGLGNKIDVKA